jgi:hypothetical protein
MSREITAAAYPESAAELVDYLIADYLNDHPVEHRDQTHESWSIPLDRIAQRLPAIVQVHFHEARPGFRTTTVLPDLPAGQSEGLWGERAVPIYDDVDEGVETDLVEAAYRAELETEAAADVGAQVAEIEAQGGRRRTSPSTVEPAGGAAMVTVPTQRRSPEALEPAPGFDDPAGETFDDVLHGQEQPTTTGVVVEAIKAAAGVLSAALGGTPDEAEGRLSIMSAAWSSAYAADHVGCAPTPDVRARAIGDIAAAVIAKYAPFDRDVIEDAEIVERLAAVA